MYKKKRKYENSHVNAESAIKIFCFQHSVPSTHTPKEPLGAVCQDVLLQRGQAVGQQLQLCNSSIRFLP